MYQVPRYADESGVGGYAACLPCQLAPSAHTVAARVGRVGKRGGVYTIGWCVKLCVRAVRRALCVLVHCLVSEESIQARTSGKV